MSVKIFSRRIRRPVTASLASVERQQDKGAMHLLRSVMLLACVASHYHHWIRGITDMASDISGHLIEINEKERLLTIYRIRGAVREFFTSVKLPEKKWAEDPEAIKEFCRTLGENLMLDSPQARRLFEI